MDALERADAGTRVARRDKPVKLFHTVDNNSTKADKYVEHGTAVSKLVPEVIAKALRKLANE